MASRENQVSIKQAVKTVICHEHKVYRSFCVCLCYSGSNGVPAVKATTCSRERTGSGSEVRVAFQAPSLTCWATVANSFTSLSSEYERARYEASCFSFCLRASSQLSGDACYWLTVLYVGTNERSGGQLVSSSPRNQQGFKGIMTRPTPTTVPHLNEVAGEFPPPPPLPSSFPSVTLRKNQIISTSLFLHSPRFPNSDGSLLTFSKSARTHLIPGHLVIQDRALFYLIANNNDNYGLSIL